MEDSSWAKVFPIQVLIEICCFHFNGLWVINLIIVRVPNGSNMIVLPPMKGTSMKELGVEIP